ncbi:Chalcone synthase 2 [Bienertia sinuspersici]
MENIQEIRNSQRAVGAACILGIGKAHPPNFIYQKDYPDYYFRVTNSEDKLELKEKFKRICEKTKITKRHFFLTEEILKKNPSMLKYGEPSHNARREMTIEYVPKLGVEAAEEALKEWGQPRSKITHLIVYTTLAMSMPGTDYEIAKLLGLEPSVQRMVLYLVGCHAGPHTLKHAKDIAENNKGARILVVCSEITAVNFHGPSENHIDSLVGQALFGDGAAAVVVGSDPVTEADETPLFQMIHAVQATVPDTTGPASEIIEMGQTFHLRKDLPFFVSKNVEGCLVKAFKSIGISDWNSIFWIAHNGGPAVLDQTEAELCLNKDKLEVTREVLSEYGNMASVGVIIMMDEIRKKSLKQGKSTTGLGFDWGVMFGFGPGMTIETLVLRSLPLAQQQP